MGGGLSTGKKSVRSKHLEMNPAAAHAHDRSRNAD
jgi:hypothetical protein